MARFSFFNQRHRNPLASGSHTHTLLVKTKEPQPICDTCHKPLTNNYKTLGE